MNGTKIFIENGEVKTVFSEDVQKAGFMDLETAKKILYAHVNKLEELYTDGSVHY